MRTFGDLKSEFLAVEVTGACTRKVVSGNPGVQVSKTSGFVYNYLHYYANIVIT